MKNFNEFVSATHRKDMQHFQKMKDADFFDLIDSIDKAGGRFTTNLQVSLKVDGLGARFGKDVNGRPFFESSRSGPIFTSNSFKAYTASRGADEVSLKRSEHYDEIFEIITHLPVINLLPEDVKIICEILYTPMGELVEDGIKFVSLTYDKSRIGSLITIIPIDVIKASTGEESENKQKVLNDLFASSTDSIKIINPALALSGDIDISALIKPITSMSPRDRQLLGSRLKADSVNKHNLRAVVDASKQQLADYILSHQAIVGKDIIGSEYEGLVLNINNRLVKITTDAYKTTRSSVR